MIAASLRPDRLAVLLGLALATGVAAGCATTTAAAPAAVETAAAVEEASIASLQARMAAGTLSSRALTQAYLDRIAALDRQGPTLRSVIGTNPAALAEADALDAERAAGHVRGPLHGIPVLLKDNIDATPMATSAGSLALSGNRPARDAFVVTRLREAGAIILGKANLSEWANFRSTRSSSGWSALGGQTRNPYVLDRNPCGSSSGTGTAIAANLAVVGIGTETDGSIICPSALAGLVGLKPTVGLVSRSGIVPIAVSQDTAGPMTRSVADAAAVLAAIAAPDPADPAAATARAPVDYLAALDANALEGARIGVVRKLMGYEPGTDAVMEQAIAAMRAAGATVVDADIATLGQWDADELTVLLHEFKAGIASYLAGTASPLRTLADLIAFNRANAGVEMRWFAQELFERAEAAGPLTDPAYVAARQRARRLAGPEGIVAALAAQRLDALVAPASPPAWPTDPVNGDHVAGAGYGPAAVAGSPSLTVPMGQVHGLPVGIVFMGPAWSEARLLALGHAFEARTRARRAPRFLPTLPDGDGQADTDRADANPRPPSSPRSP